VLMLLPPAWLEWEIDPSVRNVSLGFGIERTAYERGDTDGADVILELFDGTSPHAVFQRRLDPIRQPADQGEQTKLVVLPPRSRPMKMVLRTGPGPTDNNSWDWVYLSRLRLHRDVASALRQFPGFNRIPRAVTGNQFWLFPDGDGHSLLFLAAPASLVFGLAANPHQLELDYGFMETAYRDGGQTNGAILRIEIRSQSGGLTRLFEYYARPVEREADRKQLHAAVALPPLQPGDQLVVQLLPGDNDDASWDQLYIRRLSLD